VDSLAQDTLLGDRYRLDRRIAIGGMGEVWRAEDTVLSRTVAVKVLKSELTQERTFLERFRTEARTTASLQANGIANVFDYGEVATGKDLPVAYLVMEYVDGEPLSAQLARDGRLPAVRVLEIVRQAALALAEAHRVGMVHRDVKPGNLLVRRSDGAVKITDFGIARAADAVPLTQNGMVVGTAQYFSPEQAEGRVVGPPSDVYSLGVVAYECLAGRLPFLADSPVTVAMMQIRDAPPPLPPDVPGPVQALVMRTLAKDPRQRFADGGELAEAVRAVQEGRPIPPPSPFPVPQPSLNPAPAQPSGHGHTQSTHGQSGLVQPAVGPAALGQGVSGQAGQGQAGPGQAALAQPGAGLTGLGQAGPGQAGPGQAGPGQAGPGQAGPGQAGPGQAGPGQAGPGQAGPGQAGPGQAGPGQSGPGQSGNGGSYPGSQFAAHSGAAGLGAPGTQPPPARVNPDGVGGTNPALAYPQWTPPPSTAGWTAPPGEVRRRRSARRPLWIALALLLALILAGLATVLMSESGGDGAFSAARPVATTPDSRDWNTGVSMGSTTTRVR
jgi:serine/threonine-protein kinase